MSLKNLFVNARTKILEFKRKHNGLVDKVLEVEEDIPTNAEITELANLAIQADKDILSKIIVEYKTTAGATFIRFPKGVYPTRFHSNYEGGMTYFLVKFYQGGFYFVNSSNVNIGAVSITNNIVSLSIPGEDVSLQWKDKINYLEYTLFNGNPLDFKSLNWYNIYNPPSSGTKLYLHKLNGLTIYQGSNLYFISTNGTPITNISTQLYTYPILNAYVLGGGASSPRYGNQFVGLQVFTDVNVDKIGLHFVEPDNSISKVASSAISDFTSDTVTEL